MKNYLTKNEQKSNLNSAKILNGSSHGSSLHDAKVLNGQFYAIPITFQGTFKIVAAQITGMYELIKWSRENKERIPQKTEGKFKNVKSNGISNDQTECTTRWVKVIKIESNINKELLSEGDVIRYVPCNDTDDKNFRNQLNNSNVKIANTVTNKLEKVIIEQRTNGSPRKLRLPMVLRIVFTEVCLKFFFVHGFLFKFCFLNCCKERIFVVRYNIKVFRMLLQSFSVHNKTVIG